MLDLSRPLYSTERPDLRHAGITITLLKIFTIEEATRRPLIKIMLSNSAVYSTPVPSTHSYPLFAPDYKADDSSEIQCICGFTHDDGFTIACDQCDTWQHGFCVDVAEDAIPEKYECPSCSPRPLDVRRAKEYQSKNLEEREEKSRRKKPKSNSASNPSRKKDPSNIAVQNSGPGPPSATNKATGPGKTSVFGAQRKRGSNRTSMTTKSETGAGHPVEPVSGMFIAEVAAPSSNVLIPAMTAVADKNNEPESDTDLEKSIPVYRYDFTEITHDHYSSKDVQKFVAQTLLSAPNESITRVTSEELCSKLPVVSVISFPGNSNSFPLPQHVVTVDTACLMGQLVALCKGDIMSKESYTTEPINQYSILKHPKSCVFFHPLHPICIDSRIRGSAARFVRRSCRPNTQLSTMVVDNTIMFGLFATEPLNPNTVLTITWEWGGCPPIQRLVDGAEAEQLPSEEFQDALSWANTLTAEMGDCACVNKDDCVFTKLRVKREVSSPKPSPRTRQGSRVTQGNSSTSGSNRCSPDRQIGSDREDGYRASTSLSRDLSPTMPLHEEMSGREARKMQDLLSRIERIDQESVVKRRRKRNNTITTSTLETLSKGETSRRNKNSSSATSPPLKGGSDIVAPALPTGKPSDSSSVKSDDSRTSPIHMRPPPAPIKRIKKPDYVDSAMQTDECEGAWWNPSAAEVPITPCRISLKERLMQCMLRERENAAVESRKRKQIDISDCCPSPTESCKEQKAMKDWDVKSAAFKSSIPSATGIRVSEGPRELVHTPPEHSDETPMTSVSPPDVKPFESIPNPVSGHIPGENFTAPPPFGVIMQEHIVLDDKRTPPVSPKTLAIDVHRVPSTLAGHPVSLQVQLPNGPPFPTAPATPSPLPRPTSSPPPSTPGAQTQPPLNISTVFSQGVQIISTPTPTKTKKLSISEYSSRRKKVDHNDKKLPMSAVSEEASSMSHRAHAGATSPGSS